MFTLLFLALLCVGAAATAARSASTIMPRGGAMKATSLIFAAALIGVATPQPAFAVTTAQAPAPCAHRILCGPIHLLPRTPGARLRLVAQILASVVQSLAARAASAPAFVHVPVIDARSGAHIGTRTLTQPLQGSRAHQFAGALLRYIAVDTTEHAVQSVLHEDAADRERWTRIEAAAALGDAFALRPTFRAQRTLASDALACQRAVDVSSAAYVAQMKMPPAIISGRSQTVLPATPCARFTGSSTWAYAQLGPIGSVAISAGPPAPAPLRAASSRWQPSFVALAAQAIIEPSAHAARDVGAIHLLPRDPAERQAFLVNAFSTVIDGIVTAHGTQGDPANEADPLVRPFVRGGFSSLMGGWALDTLAFHVAARRWSPQERTLAERWSFLQHASGISSWLFPFGPPGLAHDVSAPPRT